MNPKFNKFDRRRPQDNKPTHNDQIRASEVRVVGPTGDALGIMSKERAMQIAYGMEKDLVLVVPQAQPPVCKIIEVGKFMYDQQKKQKEQAKSQRESRVDVHELQLRIAIDTHDLNIKVKKMQEWLEEGDKVRIIIKMRGREQARPQDAFDLINSVIEQGQALIEGTVQRAGNSVSATVYRKKSK